MTIEVQLLRQLDGKEAGATVEYPDADAKRLEKRGIVKIPSEKAAQAPANKMARSPQNKRSG